jgi:glutamine amidotransferase
MENLKKFGIAEILNKAVLEKKTPILGICLGVQLFTKHSEEGNVEGLGWIDAYTRKFDFSKSGQNLRIPHIGWNLVNIKRECKYWVDFSAEKRFYFVHSYYLDCKDESDVVGTSYYGHEFVSIVNRNNIFGTQFHPEKSHRDGFEIIKHFAKI